MECVVDLLNCERLRNMKTKLILRLIAITSGLVGLGIIVWVFYPIVSYNLTKDQKFATFTKTNGIDY